MKQSLISSTFLTKTFALAMAVSFALSAAPASAEIGGGSGVGGGTGGTSGGGLDIGGGGNPNNGHSPNLYRTTYAGLEGGSASSIGFDGEGDGLNIVPHDRFNHKDGDLLDTTDVADAANPCSATTAGLGNDGKGGLSNTGGANGQGGSGIGVGTDSVSGAGGIAGVSDGSKTVAFGPCGGGGSGTGPDLTEVNQNPVKDPVDGGRGGDDIFGGGNGGATADQLGELSPAAGGQIGDQNSTVCMNAYLRDENFSDNEQLKKECTGEQDEKSAV